MHERPRTGLGPYQPAVKRKDIGATFPVATARPAPTPTVARRLGGVAYGSGRYGEKESRRARAGEKFYFVRTEAFTRRQQSSASGSAVATPTQATGAPGSGTNVSDGVGSSESGVSASGRGSVGVSRSGSGSSASVTNSVSESSSPDNNGSSSSEVSSSSAVSSSDDISSSSDASSSTSVTSSSPDISSTSSSDPISSFSNTFSSFSSLVEANSSVPLITPDVSSPLPSVTPPPNETSSGISTTLFSTVIVTNSDGSESTSVIAIPTVLPYPSNAPSTTNQRTIIIGASIGGAALIIIVASLFIFLKRSEKVRLNYKKLRVFGRRRQNLLDDEDDDWLNNDHDGPGSGFRGHGLGGGSIGTPYSDYTRPVSAASSTRFRGVGGVGAGASTREGNISGHTTPFDVEGMLAESPVKPAPSPSPYLLGMRATGSGSIFHEQGVWPPPSEQSRLIDPLLAGSEQVELGNIVDHVMGDPQNQNQPQPLGPVAVAGPSAIPAHARQPSAGQSSSRYAHSTMSSYGSGSISQYPPTRNTTLSTRPNVQTAPSPALREQWEAARAQSPDSVLYDLSGTGGTLAVVNADPTTPTEGPPVPLLPPPYSSTTDVTRGAAAEGGAGQGGGGESAGQSTNWLERHPRESMEFHAL